MPRINGGKSKKYKIERIERIDKKILNIEGKK
jgi:hypothetical protein